MSEPHLEALLGRSSSNPATIAQLRKLLTEKTFIGIDFGTSTTVASLIEFDEKADRLVASPICVTQVDELGREIDHHLVPTCLAWKNDRLLVGHGAARLKPDLTWGKNIWSSFKMELGVDLGPVYFQSVLRKDGPGPTIERPRDAARLFLAFLRLGIEKTVADRGLPDDIRYVVSVPASFEANQRRDLIDALGEAGIALDTACLIDEPNAAFLSYLHHSSGAGFDVSTEQPEQRILVFDFGAGTCDVSILEVAFRGGAIRSTNRAVSRFFALGGDDIDRAIALQILLPQLLSSTSDPPTLTTDLTNRVLRRLMPEAERLKIQCCKMLETRGLGTAAARTISQTIEGRPIPTVEVLGVSLRLDQPKLPTTSFVDIMSPFLAHPDGAEEWTGAVRNPAQPVSIFEPIENAMRKAGLTADDLKAVLFIGGSSENPLVQEAVKEHFGRFVEPLVPADLRTHVSQGAALQSLLFHGLGHDIVQPITSEPILVVVSGGELQEILAAGTPVPSPEINVKQFNVQREGQKHIEVPICVSNENKMLGVLRVDSPSEQGFRKNEAVRLSCSVTRDKLLKVRVRLDDVALDEELLNPLANRELTPAEIAMLKARQNFNSSAAKGKGRPTVGAVVALAQAAMEAKDYVIAAEMFEAAERLDGSRDFATTIGYCWSKAGQTERCEAWALTAFERDPNSISAYNLAIDKRRRNDTEEFTSLLRKSLDIDPDNTAALCVLGEYLFEKNDASGAEFLERCLALLEEELDDEVLDEDDCGRLERVAGRLGRPDLKARARSRRNTLRQTAPLYEDENLLSGSAAPIAKSRS